MTLLTLIIVAALSTVGILILTAAFIGSKKAATLPGGAIAMSVYLAITYATPTLTFPVLLITLIVVSVIVHILSAYLLVKINYQN